MSDIVKTKKKPIDDIEKAKNEGRGYYTSVRGENLNFNSRGLNSRVALVSVGEEGDMTAPAAGVIQINSGPGDLLRGRHLHHGDAINLVVHGGLCMDGTWLRPGQAKIVPANLTYGDGIPSKDGCAMLEIFESHLLAPPDFEDPRTQKYFDEVHGDLNPAFVGDGSSKAPPKSVSEDRRNSARRGIEIARFDELDSTWVQTGELWTRCVFIGPRNAPDAPVGIVIKADRDVSDLVAGKRSFATTTMMVVLSGCVMHDGRWMSSGDIYVSPPNEMHGDFVFGPEGAVIFVMFNKRSGIIPKFADRKDQANFDKLLRKDAEEVAAGKSEKSVSILPLRDEHTKGRSIMFETVESVERYIAEHGLDW